MSAQIFLYKKTSPISGVTKSELRKAGFIPVGVDEMDDAAILKESMSFLKGGEIMSAALRAISRGDDSLTRKCLIEEMVKFLPDQKESR